MDVIYKNIREGYKFANVFAEEKKNTNVPCN